MRKAWTASGTAIVAAALFTGSTAFAAKKKRGAPKAAVEEGAVTESAVESAVESVFFPPWTPDGFNFGSGPVIGFRARKTELDDVVYDVASSEIGLGARLYGIPVVPGNPGLTVEPYATYTWGNRSQKAKGADLDETESSGFQRHWYGVLSRVYVKAFRYSLDLGQGALEHDKDFFLDLEAQRMANDLGLLILPFLSVHYTLTNYYVTISDESKPRVEEIDHWVHARMAFSLLDFSLDVGPGRTSTKYRSRLLPTDPLLELGTIDTQYLKALASMHLFWKLGLSASAKYILDAKGFDDLYDATDQLPNEGLSERKTLAGLPKGSLEASAFFGLSNLFAGFGIGWQYYYLELKNDDGTQVSRDHGIAINYGASI